MFYVYVYFNPLKLIDGEPEPFYVGKGSGNRYLIHLKESKQNKDTNKLKVNILKKIKAANLEPIIKKVFESEDENSVKQFEIDLIAKYGRRDLNLGPLTNLTNGGDGSSGAIQDKVAREKKSIKSIQAHLDPEIKKRRTKSLKETLAKQEIKEKYSKISKIVSKRPEIIQKKREAMLGVKNRAIEVEVNGVRYESIRAVCKELNTYPEALFKLASFKRIEKV